MAFCLTILLSVGVFSQTSDDEYNKNEFYVGYSNQQVSNNSRPALNGFEVSYVRNVSRYFGIKGDFSAAVRKQESTIGVDAGGTITQVNFRTNNQLYNFLGGVQVKDNATKSRFKPFAHALVGVAYSKSSTTSDNCPPSATTCNVNIVQFREPGFAGAFGGGLDIKINDRIDFRAIQVDYNPVYSRSSVDNNFRFGIGLVFK